MMFIEAKEPSSNETALAYEAEYVTNASVGDILGLTDVVFGPENYQEPHYDYKVKMTFYLRKSAFMVMRA
jgi:hypothetical protein